MGLKQPTPTVPDSWRRDVPLAPHTSWKIGGPAKYLCEPADAPSLASDLRHASDLDLPVFVLGGGSNILISDDGFPGLVVRYADRSLRLRPSDDGETAILRVGAQAPFAGTARAMAHRGYGGLEWAEGIPGTIGGAVVGNAGAYGGDVSEVLLRAEVLVDGSRREDWPVSEMEYGYRTGIIKTLPPGSVVVLSAEFALRRSDPRKLRDRMNEISKRRRATTPAGQTCGSVFRNPPGDSAGHIIDGLGLKGESVGGARVSDAHANYILNHEGSATAADVLALIRKLQSRVLAETGVKLIPEVQLVGFPAEETEDLYGPA